jgi:uncharacterized protein with HEPN domain
MSAREWPDRVRDIIDAIAEIQYFTRGMNLDSFRADARTIKAVELNFIIIGEASGAIPDDIRAANPAVPWQLMRSMRNRMVHLYFHIDPAILWKTVQDDLPQLLPHLENLLNSSNTSSNDVAAQ